MDEITKDDFNKIYSDYIEKHCKLNYQDHLDMMACWGLALSIREKILDSFNCNDCEFKK